MESRDPEGSVGVEFEEFSEGSGKKTDCWHKNCEISSSWLDLSRTRASSSSTASIVKMAH